MKHFLSMMVALAGFLLAPSPSPAQEDAVSVPYEVVYKGSVVATQMVLSGTASGKVSVQTSFSAMLPVFVSMHQYEESLSATFNSSGEVYSIRSRVSDGGRVIEVIADQSNEGVLNVQVSGLDGVTNRIISRSDYDFNSLALYGQNPDYYVPTNLSARVLDVRTGEIVPTTIQVISESSTFERQHLLTKHLVWSSGIYTSHSWHPEKFNHFPSLYNRQDALGDFSFRIIR